MVAIQSTELPINELTEYEKNSRTHSDDQIKALAEAQQTNENISSSNCSIAVAHENKEFAVLDESEASYYINLLDETK